MTQNAEPQDKSILGLSTDELAGLTAEELTENQTAITMLLHYYRQLVDDNSALKNENNTLKTYVEAYGRQRTNTSVGAILLAVSNVSVGFGVNLLTSGNIGPGYSSLAVGASLILAGIFFTFRKAA